MTSSSPIRTTPATTQTRIDTTRTSTTITSLFTAGISQPDTTATVSKPIESSTHRNHQLLGPADPGLTPLIICFHGSGHNPLPSWDILLKILSKNYRVLLYDRGPKICSSSNSSEADEVTALQAYLKQSGLKPRYVLLAHSYGGAFAKLLLHRRPEDVAGVVLVETGQEGGGVSQEQWRQMTRRKVLGDLPLVVIRANSLMKQWTEFEALEADFNVDFAADIDSAPEADDEVGNAGAVTKLRTRMKRKSRGRSVSGSTITSKKEKFIDDASTIVNTNTCTSPEEIKDMNIEIDKEITQKRSREDEADRKERKQEREKLKQRRAWLEAADAEDERLKRCQLELSRNAKYVHLADCGHDVIRARPEIVAEEVKWAIEQLVFTRRGTKSTPSDRGSWWKTWMNWFLGDNSS